MRKILITTFALLFLFTVAQPALAQADNKPKEPVFPHCIKAGATECQDASKKDACPENECGPLMCGITCACSKVGNCSVDDIMQVFTNIGNMVLAVVGAVVFLMYVIGGRVMTLSSNLDTNEVYDPKTDTWQSLEPMPTARGGLAAATIGNTIFVFGGESLTSTFEQNEQYIPEAGWFSHTRMPTPRHGLGAVAVDDRIYVIGGGVVPGASVSGINESYYNANFIPE
ncbi:hypothetical protein IH824_10620, partial [candidate division KSB1 bacterium]|nr:hypothetical protein [candidate division KSB1 bacterium]